MNEDSLFSITSNTGAGRGLYVGLVMCVYTLYLQMGNGVIREDGAGCRLLPTEGPHGGESMTLRWPPVPRSMLCVEHARYGAGIAHVTFLC